MSSDKATGKQAMCISLCHSGDWKGLDNFLRYNDLTLRKFAAEQLLTNSPGSQPRVKEASDIVRKYNLKLTTSNKEIVNKLLETGHYQTAIDHIVFAKLEHEIKVEVVLSLMFRAQQWYKAAEIVVRYQESEVLREAKFDRNMLLRHLLENSKLDIVPGYMAATKLSDDPVSLDLLFSAMLRERHFESLFEQVKEYEKSHAGGLEDTKLKRWSLVDVVSAAMTAGEIEMACKFVAENPSLRETFDPAPLIQTLIHKLNMPAAFKYIKHFKLQATFPSTATFPAVLAGEAWELALNTWNSDKAVQSAFSPVHVLREMIKHGAFVDVPKYMAKFRLHAESEDPGPVAPGPVRELLVELVDAMLSAGECSKAILATVHFLLFDVFPLLKLLEAAMDRAQYAVVLQWAKRLGLDSYRVQVLKRAASRKLLNNAFEFRQRVAKISPELSSLSRLEDLVDDPRGGVEEVEDVLDIREEPSMLTARPREASEEEIVLRKDPFPPPTESGSLAPSVDMVKWLREAAASSSSTGHPKVREPLYSRGTGGILADASQASKPLYMRGVIHSDAIPAPVPTAVFAWGAPAAATERKPLYMRAEAISASRLLPEAPVSAWPGRVGGKGDHDVEVNLNRFRAMEHGSMPSAASPAIVYDVWGRPLGLPSPPLATPAPAHPNTFSFDVFARSMLGDAAAAQKKEGPLS